MRRDRIYAPHRAAERLPLERFLQVDVDVDSSFDFDVWWEEFARQQGRDPDEAEQLDYLRDLLAMAVDDLEAGLRRAREVVIAPDFEPDAAAGYECGAALLELTPEPSYPREWQGRRRYRPPFKDAFAACHHGARITWSTVVFTGKNVWIHVDEDWEIYWALVRLGVTGVSEAAGAEESSH